MPNFIHLRKHENYGEQTVNIDIDKIVAVEDIENGTRIYFTGNHIDLYGRCAYEARLQLEALGIRPSRIDW